MYNSVDGLLVLDIKEVKGLSRSIESLNVKEKADLVQEVLDKKNGVNDKDWHDMVMDYDLDCSPETLRKAGVGVKLASDSGMKFPCSGDGTRNAMDGYVERQKLYDLQREIRKDLRELSRSELIREQIREAIRDMPPIDLTIPEKRKDVQNADHELVVGLGDFHYGAKFVVRGLHDEVLNTYDTHVFEYRMALLLREIKHIARIHNPGQVTIMIVGDMLDGLLRASQISRLEYGVVQSTMYLSEFLCMWLRELHEHVKLPIRVYAVRGNHGEIRPLGTKAGQFPEENMERIVMHYMYERFFENPEIHVFDDDAPMVKTVDVLGYNFLMIHGQGNDIEAMARDHQNLYSNRIDVFLCGHLHKSQTFSAGMGRNGNVLIERVPSLCGIDPYAQSKGFGSPPGATAILMERGYGRRCVYPINLS